MPPQAPLTDGEQSHVSRARRPDLSCARERDREQIQLRHRVPAIFRGATHARRRGRVYCNTALYVSLSRHNHMATTRASRRARTPRCCARAVLPRGGTHIATLHVVSKNPPQSPQNLHNNNNTHCAPGPQATSRPTGTGFQHAAEQPNTRSHRYCTPDTIQYVHHPQQAERPPPRRHMRRGMPS